MSSPSQHSSPSRRAGLILLAIGVIFGDIGTSPLYALKEAIAHTVVESHIPNIPLVLFGVLSFIFWSLTIIVSLKYATFILRADNNGEGGMLSLLALANSLFSLNMRRRTVVSVLSLVGAALFFSDATITPAISVLSAIEGLTLLTPAFNPFVVPITVGILLGLFILQRHGTSGVGKIFGPVMFLWFAVMGLMGIYHIIQMPSIILHTINPYYAYYLISHHWILTSIILGSVVLCFTGVEAFYADMGHFGKPIIRKAWFYFVFPALLCNYMGQGVLILKNPAALVNPFFLMVPEFLLIPLLVLATLATIVASQAVISGMFSIANQASSLGYLPRLRVLYTSHYEMGQIYVPVVNYILCFLVIVVVLLFKSSANLVNAYGIAVVGTMFTTTISASIVLYELASKRARFFVIIPFFTLFLALDSLFLYTNLHKIITGGWFPLVVALFILYILLVYKNGKLYYKNTVEERSVPLENFLYYIRSKNIPRVSGTAVFMTPSDGVTPRPLIYNLKHNQVLHERIFFLTIRMRNVPFVDRKDFITLRPLHPGFYKLFVSYGFKEVPNVPKILQEASDRFGVLFDIDSTSFFLSNDSIKILGGDKFRSTLQKKLFSWLTNNSARASDFFKIPYHRVIEIGTHVEL